MNRPAVVSGMFPGPDRFQYGNHAFGFRVGVRGKRLHPRPFQERVDPAHHADRIDHRRTGQRHRFGRQPCRQPQPTVPP